MRIPEWWRATPDAEGASHATPGNVSLLTDVSSPRSALTLVSADRSLRLAGELRISECGFRNGREQPLTRRVRRLRRPETSHCSTRYRTRATLCTSVRP